MTVFEKLKAEMTVETMVELGVKLVSVNNQQLYYLTSSGQLFAYTRYSDALNHEYQWLCQQLPEPQQSKMTKEELIDENTPVDNTSQD